MLLFSIYILTQTIASRKMSSGDMYIIIRMYIIIMLTIQQEHNILVIISIMNEFMMMLQSMYKFTYRF